MEINYVELSKNWATLADSDLDARRFNLLGEKIAELEKGIRQCLKENAHLADGENCTLAGLKKLIGAQND